MMEPTPNLPWTYVRLLHEPSFWWRKPLPNEIAGYDPVSGGIIAHSLAEAAQLDRDAGVNLTVADFATA